MKLAQTLEVYADKDGEPLVGNMSRQDQKDIDDWFSQKPGDKGGVNAGGPGSGRHKEQSDDEFYKDLVKEAQQIYERWRQKGSGLNRNKPKASVSYKLPKRVAWAMDILDRHNKGTLKAGGPGSGCNPSAGKCGRPGNSLSNQLTVLKSVQTVWQDRIRGLDPSVKFADSTGVRAVKDKNVALLWIAGTDGQKETFGLGLTLRSDGDASVLRIEDSWVPKSWQKSGLFSAGLQKLVDQKGQINLRNKINVHVSTNDAAWKSIVKKVGLEWNNEMEADGEPTAGNSSYSHIDPVSSFHPPSLKNPQRVPSDSPGEKNNRFLDVTKRKEAQKMRMDRLKRAAPGGLPALIPVTTTGVNPHMGAFHPSVFGKKLIQRPAKMDAGVKRTFIPYNRRGSA